jgi:tRNA-2-methylthio-N6-dimethylallyladenosine synthase
MRRGYTKEKYLELVEKIKTAVPNCTLTTDIIVGFPGETEEDFLETIDVIKKVRYDQAFTFLYSPRKGTPAASMPNQVPNDQKKQRFQHLLEVQNKISWEINQKYLNKTEEVLFEGPSKTNPNKLSGRTRGNKIVIAEADESVIGTIQPVKITDAQTWSLFGKLEQM